MEFKRVKMVYFSPTQTTKKVLECIAHNLGAEVVEDLDLTYAQQTKTTRVCSDEIVIIGAPVYAGRLSAEAMARLKQLRANNTLAILVVVYGNRAFEDALLELKHFVITLGFTPIAGGAFIGEHSYSTAKTPIAQGRPDALDLQKIAAFAKKIKDKINNVSPTCLPMDLEVPGNFPYKEAMPPNSVAPLSDYELCSVCGACIDVCPTGAIFLDEQIQTNATLCIRCCACIKNCPSEARVVEDSAWKAMAERLNTNCQARKEPEFFL
ncbi:4Fe-4S binding protein [Sulfurospirillum sp. 1612]|uniref:4Fe-4S binding protein n=1 Tax=Sulfurospirillum sp. 1612 TaxID=3094835 RepID=UPI002F95019D